MISARLVFAGLLLTIAAAAQADPIPQVAEASNMAIIGHSDLNGAGKGGEGLALRQYPDGRRILFLAHESAPMCVSIVDVTKPEDPKVVTQIPVDGQNLRCNSLGLSGTTCTTSPIPPTRENCRISTPPARIRAVRIIFGTPRAPTLISRPAPKTLIRTIS
jgi:hypothetical protein